MFVTILLSGCANRVVFVDTKSDVVRIGPGVKGHIYFMQGGQWVLSQNKVVIPEGWYAGYVPQEKVEKISK